MISDHAVCALLLAEDAAVCLCFLSFACPDTLVSFLWKLTSHLILLHLLHLLPSSVAFAGHLWRVLLASSKHHRHST
jgi:hypothetical protein